MNSQKQKKELDSSGKV